MIGRVSLLCDREGMHDVRRKNCGRLTKRRSLIAAARFWFLASAIRLIVQSRRTAASAHLQGPERQIRLVPQRGFLFVASLIPVSACQQVSELRSVSCLLALLFQIIQQLAEHEQPECTDMGVHWAPWVTLGPKLGPSRGLIGAKSGA